MTSKVMVGGVPVGGGARVSVQSMCNTDTRDVAATVAQIAALARAGCEIVRVAVPDMAAAQALGAIVAQISIPLVADIHFDYRLAIAAAEAGVQKLRINPGNIGGEEKVRALVACARAHHLPIRIGVNAGSLEKDILAKYGGPTPQGMVDSALGHVRLLEREGFEDIVISLKASDVASTVAAYRIMARTCDYPLHIGVTEAGTARMGTIKSAIGIGSLLLDGIGDTLRVSLTDDPVREVETGLDILRAIGLRKDGVSVISCPTCGRTQVDLVAIAKEVQRRVRDIRTPLTVAVMGCVVNGPGEARYADVGMAGGRDTAVLFRHGERIRTVRGAHIVDELMAEIQRVLAEKQG
nr:flavodoxin-dependent (E)-4-hydroxy-3-methylbut-2-enyl-diphosphate synthase [Maliibacterium massiliense]